MSFTNKVSNIIKQKIAGNLVNGFTNAIGSIGQPKKLAAKLANKSPLDLSQSPVAHMEPINHSFSYGSVYYPTETSNLGDGHYIIFDIIENNKTNYGGDGDRDMKKMYPKSLGQVGERKLNQSKRLAKLKAQGFQTSDNIVRSQQTGISTSFNTHSRLSDSIILYTPSTGTKFDYKVGYENIDTGIAGLAAGLLDNKDIIAGLKGIGGSFLENITKAAIEIALPGFGGVIDKARGKSINPNGRDDI